MIRRLVLWGTLALIFVAVNVQTYRKEQILAHGQTMLLRLAPRDPRSLMQGDYMVLRYQIADALPTAELAGKGRVVVQLDTDGVVTALTGVYRGEPLKPGERLLVYRNRNGLRFGAESFFFQEGQADLYARAAYGELKVAPSGEAVLIGLRDAQRRPLGAGP